MSIINDALKKADYLKKWKTLKPAPSVRDSQNGGTLVEERESSQTPASSESFQPKIQKPPFQVKFERPPAQKARTFISTARLVLIVFLTCFFLAAIIGPWFYVWVNQMISSKIPPSSRQAVESDKAEEQRVILHSTTPVQRKQQYQEYLNPNAARAVSVIPVPRTLKEQVKSHPEYQLSGTSMGNNNERYAILNGKLSKAGDTTDDAEVLEIRDQEVLLRKDGKEFTVKLG